MFQCTLGNIASQKQKLCNPFPGLLTKRPEASWEVYDALTIEQQDQNTNGDAEKGFKNLVQIKYSIKMKLMHYINVKLYNWTTRVCIIG